VVTPGVILVALAGIAAAVAGALAAFGFAPASAVTAFVAALLALLGGFSLRQAATANRELEAAARRMVAGDLGARAPIVDSQGATIAFNDMAEHVEGLIESIGQEREILVAALNSIGDAVVAVDEDGEVVFANTAARQAFGSSGAPIIGNPFVWIFPEEHIVEALRASRDDQVRATHVVERPGKQLYQVTTAPILEGGEWRALAVFHDITEIRRVESVRRDFVANVSHELRTPLAAVKSVIETLQSGALEEPEVAKDFLNRADREVDRLVTMVEELLELSRIESGEAPMKERLVDIGGVIADAVARLEPQASRAGLTLTADVSPGLQPVTGDPEQLERVVVNLVQNAIKFTPPGGNVEVLARAIEMGVEVSVSDTGDGILPEDLDRVFERFYKADRARESSGTGLGLAVAKHTVEAHGGTISAESEPGKGATFRFTLPAARGDSATASAAS
jgi:two-component system phosphate regulon sensor histidine kinase PhoR